MCKSIPEMCSSRGKAVIGECMRVGAPYNDEFVSFVSHIVFAWRSIESWVWLKLDKYLMLSFQKFLKCFQISIILNIYKGRYTPLKTKVRFFLYLVYNRMPLWIFMRQMVNARVRQATLLCFIYSDTLYLQKMNASLHQDNHYTDMQNLCKL